VLVDSLEDIERIDTELQKHHDSDPELKGRMKIRMNRPRRGDEEIDNRLDRSSVFGPVDRYAYGRNGVQAFIETDLLASGPLADSMVLELDYIFPGNTNHLL
jgi:hypothetical protein